MIEKQGFFFPDSDRDCVTLFHEVTALEEFVFPRMTKFDTVVQAGGNVGIFPRKLAGKFKTVYTFEPNHDNFECLVKNVTNRNVIKFQAVLGNTRELVNVEVPDSANMGKNFVKGSGFVPTVRIDDLALNECDLLYLDIEGFELEALKGAIETLVKFHPAIAIEENVCCQRYGVAEGETGKWLQQFGYKEVKKYYSDILYLWQP